MKRDVELCERRSDLNEKLRVIFNQRKKGEKKKQFEKTKPG